MLDVAFNEDQRRARTGYAARNDALLRRCAPNLLCCEPTVRVGVKAKRLKAGWSDDYLAAVLRAYDAIALGRGVRAARRPVYHGCVSQAHPPPVAADLHIDTPVLGSLSRDRRDAG